jgi:hypothetical protein
LTVADLNEAEQEKIRRIKLALDPTEHAEAA